MLCLLKYNIILSLSLSAIGSNSDLNTIRAFAFGVGFAALIRILTILVAFVNHCRQWKTLWSFFGGLQLWIELPMLLFSFIFVSVYTSSCLCPASWQWQIGTVAVLLVWVDLITFMRSLQLFDIGKIVVLSCSIVYRIIDGSD